MAVEKSICPNCQAETYGVDQCWLCRTNLNEPSTMPSLASGGLGSVAPTSLNDRHAESDPYRNENPYAPPVPIADNKESGSYSIVLAVGLAIVFAALFAVAPGLAILLGIFVAPAFIRTAVVISRKKQQGEVIAVGDRSVLFMASVGGVLLACIAALGTFFIACAAACFGLIGLDAAGMNNSGMNGQNVFGGMLIISALASLIVGGMVLWSMWKQKPK